MTWLEAHGKCVLHCDGVGKDGLVMWESSYCVRHSPVRSDMVGIGSDTFGGFATQSEELKTGVPDRPSCDISVLFIRTGRSLSGLGRNMSDSLGGFATQSEELKAGVPDWPSCDISVLFFRPGRSLSGLGRKMSDSLGRSPTRSDVVVGYPMGGKENELGINKHILTSRTDWHLGPLGFVCCPDKAILASGWV